MLGGTPRSNTRLALSMMVSGSEGRERLRHPARQPSSTVECRKKGQSKAALCATAIVGRSKVEIALEFVTILHHAMLAL
jgi:hypothetical protein